MGLSSEHQLLILCARRTLDEGMTTQLERLARSPIDWSYVEKIALIHRVAPLLHKNLSVVIERLKHEEPLSLEQTYLALGKVHTSTILHNLVQYEEMHSLVSFLEAAGVTPVVLKGPVLAKIVYKDIGLRPFADLDFLVNRQDLAKACETLFGIGYVQERATKGQSVAQLIQSQGQDHYHLIPFTKLMSNILPISVEIHYDFWTRVEPFKIDIPSMLADSQVIEIDTSRKMRILSPEHLLIHLCCHVFIHARKINRILDRSDLYLLWFCDIYETIMHYHEIIDWHKLLSFVKAHNLNLPVFFSLHYMSKIYGQCVSYEIMKEIEPADLRELDRFEENIGEKNGGFWRTPFPERLFIDRRREVLEILRGGERLYSRGQVLCPKVSTPPVIDGNLNDPSWEKAGRLQICEDAVRDWQHFGTHIGWGAAPRDSTDLSAICYVCWDENNFYFAGEINDDVLVFDRETFYVENLDGVELSFCYPETPEIKNLHLLYQNDAASESGYRIAMSITDTGYIIEASIPWPFLGISVQENMTIRFDIQIHDCDNPKEGRKTTLVWSGGRDLSWRDPVVLGELVLQGGFSSHKRA